MGWFDEQIRSRKLGDQDRIDEALKTMTRSLGIEGTLSQSQNASSAIEGLLRYFKIEEEVGEIDDINEVLERTLRPHGIMRRTVKLDDGWYKDACGAFLGTRRSDDAVILFVPSSIYGYSYLDPDTGKMVHVNKKNAAQFNREAMAFYKSFPLKSLGLKDVIFFILGIMTKADWLVVLASSAVVTMVGFLLPRINLILYGTVLESGNLRVFTGIAVFMVCTSISQILLGSVNTLVASRMENKINLYVEASSMMRLLSMPPSFFRQFGAGETAARMEYMTSLCSTLTSLGLSTGLSSLFSLAYVGQIFRFAPSMVLPSLVIILATVIFSAVQVMIRTKITRRQMEEGAKERAMSYALISGIQKIRLSGAERRSFARWAQQYSKETSLQYNPPASIKLGNVINTAISLAGVAILYYVALNSGISVATYNAFMVSYTMASTAFMSLASFATTTAQINPILEMVKPMMETAPESSAGGQIVDKLQGTIECSHITFQYSESMPKVLDDLSLRVKAGEYLAIVGETGCGKSTLLRILLGFEKPQKGGIYYDKKNLDKLDLKSVRRRIGVVLQNGKLFNGSIYENIVLAAPWLSLNDAWAAAELAGIADDIRAMPMGMQTMISEGTGGISGGQKQRIMIARALAPKPKILMFDEATSALDNITQKKVSDALAALHCTRIVIAHRLSTIAACDRIIYLKEGHIVEDGTYDELIARGGLFAKLVERQRLG